MMSTMFSEPDLETMQRVRCAFDPLQLSNPSKIFPRPRLCGEKPGEYVAHPLETAGNAGGLPKDGPRSPKTKSPAFVKGRCVVLSAEPLRDPVTGERVGCSRPDAALVPR